MEAAVSSDFQPPHQQPLLTQPQQLLNQGDEKNNNCGYGACDDVESVGTSINDNDNNIEINAADIFGVEEAEGDNSNGAPAVGDAENDDLSAIEDDGYRLLTQALNMENNDDVESSSSDESSDDGSESSGTTSSDDDSDSGSSQDEHALDADGTPLQERRERNMRRNKAFVDNLKLELNAMMNQGKQPPENVQGKKKKRKVAVEVEESTMNVAEDTSKQRRRRGMLFSTHTNTAAINQRSIQTLHSQSNLIPSTKSLVDELNSKYPHRTNQIKLICSQLVNIVQKSKFAWQMKNNVGNIQYSEASYQGDIKMATPAPLNVTGAGGCGKSCIVRDAMTALGRMHPSVTNAYIDCASSESGSVASVMNSAYRQLYECYHFNNGFGRYDKDEVVVKGKTKSNERGKHSSAGIARSSLGGGDFAEDIESDDAADDDESMGEVELERQRSRAQANGRNIDKKAASAKAKKKSNSNVNLQNNVRQTRLSSAMASKAAASQPATQTVGLQNASIPSATGKNTQNIGSVALFGRATSALIQAGNNTRKRSSNNNWRCAFLILDNAERILAWKKHGSINPLTQIFLLPSVMGINLTLIFISRSTIFKYSSVHNPPGTLLDAVHPQSIHFNSYTSVETIKSILQVPHIRQLVMGRSSLISHTYRCNIANQLRLKINDWLYASMLNSFVPSVKSSTHDITEIMRLARLLWPEYVGSGSGDPAFETSMWQVLGDTTASSMSERCNNESDCLFCQNLQTRYSKVGDDNYPVVDLSTQKQRLCEKLDRNIRDTMRSLLSSTAMMPGRVLIKQNSHPYAARLPYITKFLLLSAFLCQNKRSELDANLYTTINTGKSKSRKRANKDGDEAAYVASAKNTTQRQPSFPLERMLSVFYSVISQYGQHHYMAYKEEGASVSVQLGTERLFQSIQALIATGLLHTNGGAKFNDDLMEKTTAKFSCLLMKEDALVIAANVGFPLTKYCPF